MKKKGGCTQVALRRYLVQAVILHILDLFLNIFSYSGRIGSHELVPEALQVINDICIKGGDGHGERFILFQGFMIAVDILEPVGRHG